jgi:hypothetical protein
MESAWLRVLRCLQVVLAGWCDRTGLFGSVSVCLQLLRQHSIQAEGLAPRLSGMFCLGDSCSFFLHEYVSWSN